MGASGSMVASRDGNIEMNIVDERKTNGHPSMPRHNSQPSSKMFSSFKPKQKDNTIRTSTLRTSGSFGPLTTPVVGPAEAVGKVKMEYDTLKFTKDQEIQDLKRKEQKLEMENNRLRAELHALNKQCQKLRAERDNAVESCNLAMERATALEQNREKIQRQFKIFRENKEAEVQALLQAKRKLESTFHRLQAHGMATSDDHNVNENIINRTIHNTVMPLEDDSNWWAAPESETTSIFGSYAQLQNGSQVGFAESAADFKDISKQDHKQESMFHSNSLPLRTDAWLTSSTSLSNLLDTDVTYACESAILRCYISATPDLVSEAKSLINCPEMKKMKMACEKEGYFLSIIHFLNFQGYSQVSDEQQSIQDNAFFHGLCSSSIIIYFLGNLVGKYTEFEIDECHLQSVHSKSLLFCIKNNADKTESQSKFIINKVVSSSAKRCVYYNSPGDARRAGIKEISKAVRLEFGVRLESNTSDPGSTDENEVTYLNEIMLDPHMERIQNELSSYTNNPKCIQPVGFEKCYDRLEEVITSPGPVPPLLVSGTHSSGKTLLLSSWTSQLRSSRPDVLILQHFVTGSNSIDAHPVIVLRRLLSQLCHHFPHGSHPPLQSCSTYDVNRLRQSLPRLIEQLSSRRNKRILLVVDSIDRVEDVQRYFSWLLDPLPVGVRVIFSVDVDSCPEEWRQLPTLHLEPLSIHAVKSLLREHAAKRGVEISSVWERDVVSHCRTASTCHPLYVTLLSAIVCSVCDGQATDNLFRSCSKKQDSSEIYNLLVRDIELSCESKEAKLRFKYIMQFIVCSRNGLSETELMSFLPDLTWYEWFGLYSRLIHLCIVKEQGGVVIMHNSTISDLIFSRYIGNEVQERKSRLKMITCLKSLYTEHVTPRTSDLFLWILRKDEERETLLELLKSPFVFQILYTCGRNSELVEMWSFLNEDKDSIVKYYREELKKLEGTSSSVSLMAEVAKLYQTLGRFLKDLNLMEEAVSALQKSLEIQETVLDPDHPAVADSLHYLASVYSHWGKPATAESLYKQALELVESTVGGDHLRVAQELSALSRIVRKSGRQDEFERLHRRVVSIESKSATSVPTRMENLRKRALRLEELTLDDDSSEMANALNDLGVLQHMQNNFVNAESFFLRSLKMREKLVGLEHPDAAQSFHNLASVYSHKKDYKRAVECMDKALKIRKKHFSNSVIITNTLKNLAVLYKKAKEFPKACEIYQELLEISIETSGEESELTANALVNLAVAECQNERLDVALPLYKKALRMYKEIFGPKSQQVSQTLKNIAVLLYQQEKYEEAALVYKESLGNG